MPWACRADSQQSVSFGGDRFWRHWARMIMRRPRQWAAVSIVILLALAAPITRLNLALDTGTSDIHEQSAGLGREILEREFNEGRISPLQVVYVSRDGALDDADLDAIARLCELLSNDYAVVEVTSVTTLLDRFAGNHSAETLKLAAGFPQVVEASGDLINLASGGDVAVIRAVPRWSPDSPGPLQLVERIRETIVPNMMEELDPQRRGGRRRSERPDRRYHHRIAAQAAAGRRSGGGALHSFSWRSSSAASPSRSRPS